MQSDRERWSFTRLIVLLPSLPIFLYQLYTIPASIDQIARAILYVVLAGCIAAFFGALVEDGGIKAFLSRKS